MWELSLLHVTHLLVLLFIPTKYESNPLKNNGNIQLWKKVNLGRHPTPARPDIAILKDRFFLKNPSKKAIEKVINKNHMKWIFSYWPCYRSLASHIGLMMAVLALGLPSGQYSHPQASLRNWPRTCNRANLKTFQLITLYSVTSICRVIQSSV